MNTGGGSSNGGNLASSISVINDIDPTTIEDIEIVKGPTDILDHASQYYGWTGKLGIDATKKWPDEGFTREWPGYNLMDETVKKRVAEQMGKYKI